MNAEIRERIEQVQRGEVPEGYNETSIGVIPATWRVDKLEKHLDVHDELSNDTQTIPVVTSSREGLMLQSEYYQQQRFEETRLGYHVVPRGYVTYRHMSDDDIFRFNVNNLADAVLVSPEYPVFTTKSTLLQSVLVDYLNTSPRFLTYCRAQKKGSTRTRMYFSNLQAFMMPIQPVSEQRKIAQILAHCDKVIELKEQLIEEKRSQKKWLMQNLLNPDSGVRLPGFEGSEWHVYTMGELGSFAKGTGISNEDCSSGEWPCIKYGDIYMSYNTWFACPVSFTEEDIAANSPLIRQGTLLFTGSGEDRLEIGKCTAYVGDGEIAVGGDIIIMYPNVDVVDPLFLAYQQYTDALVRQKAEVSQGYSIVHLYADGIKQLLVHVPCNIKEQRAIASVILNSDQEIDLLEQELGQWQTKKKALMQLLLTGIVRVTA